MRVMVADHEGDIGFLCEVALGYEGFEVVRCDGNGDLADRVSSERPDALVVELPPWVDSDTIRRIRDASATSHVPIVVLSTRSRAADVRDILESGADVHLLEPFSLRTLIAYVRRLARMAPGDRAARRARLLAAAARASERGVSARRPGPMTADAGSSWTALSASR